MTLLRNCVSVSSPASSSLSTIPDRHMFRNSEIENPLTHIQIDRKQSYELAYPESISTAESRFSRNHQLHMSCEKVQGFLEQLNYEAFETQENIDICAESTPLSPTKLQRGVGNRGRKTVQSKNSTLSTDFLLNQQLMDKLQASEELGGTCSSQRHSKQDPHQQRSNKPGPKASSVTSSSSQFSFVPSIFNVKIVKPNQPLHPEPSQTSECIEKVTLEQLITRDNTHWGYVDRLELVHSPRSSFTGSDSSFKGLPRHSICVSDNTRT